MENFAIILAGGVGERLWPLSKSNFPKQFLEIEDGKGSLIYHTYKRLTKIVKRKNIFVITNKDFKSLTHQHLKHIPTSNILCEPMQKNTATAICYALNIIKKKLKKKNGNIIVTPSDAYIRDSKNFVSCVENAFNITSESDAIVTLGIRPNEPNINYDYIHYDKDSFNKETKSYNVKGFKEKPTEETAKKYIEAGEYLWNAGIFMLNIDSCLNAFQEFMPETLDLVQDAIKQKKEEDLVRIFSLIQPQSFDKGIIEKYKNIHCIKSNFQWDDVGSLINYFQHRFSDNKEPNITDGSVITLYSKNNTIIGKDKLVAALGVKNLIIIENEDVVLVANKDDINSIKDLIQKIKESDYKKHL